MADLKKENKALLLFLDIFRLEVSHYCFCVCQQNRKFPSA